jgi:two-component system chemotaxis response regulator CheY
MSAETEWGVRHVLERDETSLTETETPPGKVLIVDDSGYARRRLRRFLVAHGWTQVIEASDGIQAIELFSTEHPSLVLVDQVMRGMAGLETARLLLEKDPNARIAMFTAVSDPAVREQALRAGILNVVKKADWISLEKLLSNELRGSGDRIEAAHG